MASRLPSYTAIVLYVLLAAFTAYRHEPWADESQSWLLARDAGLWQLWTRLLHYEGTPGLWQTLLHILIGLGLSYSALNFVSVIAGTAAAWLVINSAPLPLLIRITLPFTFYLFYQYGVIARSYSLLPVLTFGCAILYQRTSRRPYLFILMLCLLAAVSLGGFVLAILIYGDFLLRAIGRWRYHIGDEQKRIARAAGVFLPAALLLAWCAWPAGDNQFVKHLNFSAQHIWKFSLAMIQYAFTGEWLTTIAAITLSLPFLFRGGSLPLFLAATFCLCVLHSVVYMHVWHFGALSLAWIFCMWTAASRVPLTSIAKVSLTLVILFQGYWTAESVRYDWAQPYSGSLEAARFLQAHSDIESKGLYLANFSSTAVKPYFSAADLSRMTRDTRPGYWDWSARGNSSDPLPLMTTDRFGYLLAGYKLPTEQTKWAELARISGFQLVRRFEGHLFWRTSILEPESFDLYRRVSQPLAADLSNSIDMSDPSTAVQLINGFSGLESNAWRWTERSFSVALRRPEGADVRGARLALRLFIPDNQIRDLGTMTLRAHINGRPLRAEGFARPGAVEYLRDIPAEDLDSPLTVVTFSFDKFRKPSGQDDRELGAIAKAVVIQTK